MELVGDGSIRISPARKDDGEGRGECVTDGGSDQDGTGNWRYVELELDVGDGRHVEVGVLGCKFDLDLGFGLEVAEEVPDAELDSEELVPPDSHLVEVVDERPRVAQLIWILAFGWLDGHLQLLVDVDAAVLEPRGNLNCQKRQVHLDDDQQSRDKQCAVRFRAVHEEVVCVIRSQLKVQLGCNDNLPISVPRLAETLTGSSPAQSQHC